MSDSTQEQDTDFQIMQAFKRRYERRYKLGRDLAEDGTVIGHHIRTTFYPERKSENGEAPYCIWEYSDTTLAAPIPGRTARAIVRKYPFVKLHVESDEGHELLFPADRLKELEAVLKLRRKRKLSPEQRETQVERLRKYQFRSQVAGEK